MLENTVTSGEHTQETKKNEWVFAPIPKSKLFIDLTGMKFNSLTVLGYIETKKCGGHLYAVRCDCGNEFTTRSQWLLHDKVKTCPSCRHKLKIKSLLGMKFGKLTVIEQIHEPYAYMKYKCRCDCGNEKVIMGAHLSDGSTTSCGCSRYVKSSKLFTKSLVGKTFGILYVKERIENGVARRPRYRCVCKCGNECDVVGNELRNMKQRSCGKCGLLSSETVFYTEDEKLKILSNRMRGTAHRLTRIGIKKHEKTNVIIGCSSIELLTYFRQNFTDVDSIFSANFHIDHIIPLAYAKTIEEIFILSHHLNLQPLHGDDNLTKSDTMPENVDVLFHTLSERVKKDRAARGLCSIEDLTKKHICDQTSPQSCSFP